MSTFNTDRWGGLAAMLGGLLWIGFAAAVASRPEGCIADACYLPGRSMRVWDDLAPLFIAAVLLILAGIAALVARAWKLERFGRLGRGGLVLGACGLLTLLVGGLVQELVFGGDFPHMPLVVVPGIVALGLGFSGVGMGILRAQVLPRWMAWLLVVGALLLLASNDQNARVLFWVPLGLAWLVLGYTLWSKTVPARRVPRRPAN